MHAMKNYKSADNIFWDKFRKDLEAMTKKLITANTGTLLGPPLMDKHKHLRMNIEITSEANPDAFMQAICNGNKKLNVKVSHLDALPEILEPEAYVWKKL